MQTERQELIEKNIKLAYWMAGRYKGCGIEHEDLISLCFVGLTKAADTYTAGKSAFATYASRCMANEVLQELRKEKYRIHYALSLDMETEDSVTLAAVVPDQRDYYNELIDGMSKIDWKGICQSVLTLEEQSVIRLLFLEGATQFKAAADIGRSQAQVSRIRARAIKKLRAAVSCM